MIGSTNAIWDFYDKNEQLVNYIMLYDGTIGDATLNQCIEVTGGWVGGSAWKTGDSGGVYSVTDSYIRYGEESTSSYASKYMMPKNKLDITEYDGLFVKTKDTCSASSYRVYVNMCFIAGDFIPGTTGRENGSQRTELSFVTINTNYNNNLRLSYLDISEVYGEQYVMLWNHSGAYANLWMYSDCYEVALVKNDNWKELAKKAGIEVITMEDLLLNSSTLLFNEKAVDYMIHRCTGSFMANAIKSEEFLSAFNNSPYKTKILANEHWAKFLSFVA